MVFASALAVAASDAATAVLALAALEAAFGRGAGDAGAVDAQTRLGGSRPRARPADRGHHPDRDRKRALKAVPCRRTLPIACPLPQLPGVTSRPPGVVSVLTQWVNRAACPAVQSPGWLSCRPRRCVGRRPNEQAGPVLALRIGNAGISERGAQEGMGRPAHELDRVVTREFGDVVNQTRASIPVGLRIARTSRRSPLGHRSPEGATSASLIQPIARP